MTNSKTQRLLRSLQNGNELTAEQAMTRFGFFSAESVRSAISDLRYNGYPVYANVKHNGNVVKYRIGTPTRSLIAAGYTQLASA